ncbi:uncharacterized protein LOC107222048 [Neodiprion lecontei]|uniref:Uncharacterized protein LOC107222048 n=1 Tax=Neodiprion lecontei TaxID=441921 RepID=A0ABM3FH88_NEOLC|nr:uncharacterized protein LOC107222048 [Neodiprion lecontei]XP_046587390.1 uncharacterized protein LOC107222048 [Neodiprion lecontei]
MSSLAIIFIITIASSLGSRTSAAPADETSYDRNRLKVEDATDEEASASPLTESPISSTKDEVEVSEDQENESRVNFEDEASRDLRSENSPDAVLEDEEDYKKDKRSKSKSKGRKHKALFIDYPFIPQLAAMPSYDAYDELQDTEGRTPSGGGGNGALRKGFQESNIYYIRLPPTPYIFVPGLGYVSQPPTYSTGHRIRPQIGHVRPQLDPYRPHHPQPIYNSPLNEINPFINLPVDFVSNGKPTGVYQWQSQNYQPHKRPETHIATLDKGPYFFNGRPHSIYLLRPDARPPVHQSVQFPDYQDSSLYY